MFLNWQMTETEYDRLNPPPIEVVEDEEGQTYYKVMGDSKWLFVGWVPAPQTAPGWFLYHLIHGLAMRYPAHKVLAYSVKHSFLEAPEDWG